MPYKCSISFGLVYIPVTLISCVKSNEISFNLLDKKTNSRIKYKKTCEECHGEEVKAEDIVKGFKYDTDQYVIFTDKDLEKLKTKKDKNIVITQFVNAEEIDPIFYDRPYYVHATGAEKAFALLREAMETENKVGIAKTVIGSKETLIALRTRDNQMLLNTLFFHDEIVKNTAKEIVEKLDKQELDLAKTIIKSMVKPFEPENYKDEYQERIRAAIEQKIAGKEIVSPKEEETENVANLMQALQLSLNVLKKNKTARK